MSRLKDSQLDKIYEIHCEFSFVSCYLVYVVYFQEVEEEAGSVSNVRRKDTWPGTVLMLPHRVSWIMPKEIMFYINYFCNC